MSDSYYALNAKLAKKILACPSCKEELSFSKDQWNCTSCKAAGVIDDVGIIHLTDEDFYYREAPRETLAPILKAKNRKDLLGKFKSIVENIKPSKRDFFTFYSLSQRRGAIGVLADGGKNTVTLDFGSGWGNIAKTVSYFGGVAVSVDMTYESLRFARLMSDNPNREIHIKAGRTKQMPFKKEVFDTVILNGVLEWLPEGFKLNKSPREVQLGYLREFKRVLKDSGSLVTGIENRLSFIYFSGAKEDHTSLRYGALFPRWISNIYSLLLKSKPYRTYTYSKKGYKELFKEAGFSRNRFHIPWLRYRKWLSLYRSKTINEAKLSFPTKTGWQKMVGRIFFAITSPFKIFDYFVPDFYIISRKSSRASSAGIVLEQVSGSLAKIKDISSSSPERIKFETKDFIYKIPLCKQSEISAKEELEIQNKLIKLGFDRYIVPIEGMEKNGLFFTRSKKLIINESDIEAKQEFALKFYDLLTKKNNKVKFSRTSTYKRILGSGVLESEDCTKFKKKFEKLGEREVVASMSHGDFHQENILISDKNYIIDWDLFGDNAFAAIDPIHYLVFNMGYDSYGHLSVSDGIKVIIGNDVSKNRFWKKAMEKSDMSKQELLMVYILDRLAKEKGRTLRANYFISKPDNLKSLSLIN